jgi:hypothetical protein
MASSGPLYTPYKSVENSKKNICGSNDLCHRGHGFLGHALKWVKKISSQLTRWEKAGFRRTASYDAPGAASAEKALRGGAPPDF